MSYLTQSKIAGNRTMNERVAQCAVIENPGDPGWAAANARLWASSPDWDTAWEYSMNSHPDDPEWDPGADEAVITDGMILSSVQFLLNPPEPEPPDPPVLDNTLPPEEPPAE